MKKSITMTAWRRPNYTVKVIESLKSCYNINNYILYAHLEPGYNDNVDLFKKIDFMECHIVLNKQRLGGPLNSYNAVSHGLEHDDFIVHVDNETSYSMLFRCFDILT